MMKFFMVTAAVILCAFLDTSILYTNAQSDNSADSSISEIVNTTSDFSDDDDRKGNKSGDCSYNVTKGGQLKTNGTVKPSEKCVWHISTNATDTAPSGLLFENVLLDDSDNVTVHLTDENETLIFGPYHGALRPVVIAVDLKNFTVKLSTSDKTGNRVFQVVYNENCVLPIPPTIEEIESPIYLVEPKLISCTYDYNKLHEELSYSFVFKNFSLDSQSTLEVLETNGQDAKYQTTPPDIFGAPVRFNMTLNANFSSNKLTIVRRKLYHPCSDFIKVPSTTIPVLQSPPPIELHNDSTYFECRWLIRTDTPGSTLRLLVDKFQFNSVLDSLIINDGPSELSEPIVQAALVNQNETKAQMIRTSGSYMWISFRSEGFASHFSGNYSSDKGGYQHGSGNISVQSDEGAVVFLLEVSADEKVYLNFSLTSFANPGAINIYDDFSTMSSPIAQLNGSIWYPVISSTSKMMVVPSSSSHFTANFIGLKSDCILMSASSNDAYVLSGNCNSVCAWVVPPKNVSEGVLLLGFQFLSLDVTDVVEVFRLGNSEKSVAKILHGVTHVPQLTFSPREGLYMKISRGECSRKDDVVLVAHTTFVPSCLANFTLDPSVQLQLSSPNYPNTYPLFANCQWNLIASGNTSQFYLTFSNMKLAPNHCIRVTQSVKGTPVVLFSGDELPNDILIGNSVIQFDSFNCNVSGVHESLVSSEGFLLNVTSSDCGGIVTSKTGSFNTSLTSSRVNSSCFWIVQVPYKESDGSVNSIIFTYEEKGTKGSNSEFFIYDGPSVREAQMTNLTGNVWSRNNTVIFAYKKANSSAAVYTISYKTINCNKTLQCANGICLHPDWLCNGKNDCGDFTDERNCETVPVPDSVKQASGVSPLAFGLVTVLFFGMGALAAFLVPKAINRYRTGRYHQFQDYAGVD